MTISASPPLVLVVEDYDDAREMYCAWLRIAGCRVEEAADGREAVEKALALAPDLVVMDLSLPVMDGRAAIGALRAHPQTRAVPIVALSGDATAGLERSEAGWNAFVPKPCMPDGLVTAVRLALGPRAAPDPGASPT